MRAVASERAGSEHIKKTKPTLREDRGIRQNECPGSNITSPTAYLWRMRKNWATFVSEVDAWNTAMLLLV